MKVLACLTSLVETVMTDADYNAFCLGLICTFVVYTDTCIVSFNPAFVYSGCLIELKWCFV